MLVTSSLSAPISSRGQGNAQSWGPWTVTSGATPVCPQPAPGLMAELTGWLHGWQFSTVPCTLAQTVKAKVTGREPHDGTDGADLSPPRGPAKGCGRECSC